MNRNIILRSVVCAILVYFYFLYDEHLVKEYNNNTEISYREQLLECLHWAKKKKEKIASKNENYWSHESNKQQTKEIVIIRLFCQLSPISAILNTQSITK